MGWIVPVLEAIGGEVVGHEHNHCGQCWGEIRLKSQPMQSLAGLPVDITKDPRWQRGYLERWEKSEKLPVLPGFRETDPVEVLRRWFAGDEALTVLGRGPSAVDAWTRGHLTEAVITTDPTYATRDVYGGEPRGVLIGDNSHLLEQVSQRFHATPADQRPLLMHMFLPGAPMLPFARYKLPRPVPILPLLVRENVYQHEPFSPYPTTGVFALLLAAALGKRVTVAGIDLYRHPTGQAYMNEQTFRGLPKQHSEACDLAHIRRAFDRLGENKSVNPHLAQLVGERA
jgi:hypothetical protein